MRIHISKECNAELTNIGGFKTEERGLTNMKGKGDVMTYWLLGTTDQNPIISKPDFSKPTLRPFFKNPKNLVTHAGSSSQEVKYNLFLIDFLQLLFLFHKF